jgi:hypothetical protein
VIATASRARQNWRGAFSGDDEVPPLPADRREMRGAQQQRPTIDVRYIKIELYVLMIIKDTKDYGIAPELRLYDWPRIATEYNDQETEHAFATPRAPGCRGGKREGA